MGKRVRKEVPGKVTGCAQAFGQEGTCRLMGVGKADPVRWNDGVRLGGQPGPDRAQPCAPELGSSQSTGRPLKDHSCDGADVYLAMTRSGFCKDRPVIKMERKSGAGGQHVCVCRDRQETSTARERASKCSPPQRIHLL